MECESKCNCGNDGKKPHTCPFLSDVDNDIETKCNCCDKCTDQCADDI